MRHEETWQVDGPFQLASSLWTTLPRGPTLAKTGPDQASYALWTETGPAMVSLQYANGKLKGSAIGPGASRALAEVPRTVGLDDDPSRFEPGVGLVREMHRRYRGMRLGATGRVFDALLPAIIGQRVTTDEARHSYRRLVRMTGQPAPGDRGLILPPTPDAILRLRQPEFQRLGIEMGRARVILEAARRAARTEEIGAMERDAAKQRLEALPGIGPWTSAQVMATAWGDRDAVPRGDFHLPNMVAWALAGEPRATDERMMELLEVFRPSRRRALLLIKRSGIHAPRYGPRAPKSVIVRGAD